MPVLGFIFKVFLNLSLDANYFIGYWASKDKFEEALNKI